MEGVLKNLTVGARRALEEGPCGVAVSSLGTLRTCRSCTDGGLGTAVPRLTGFADRSSSPAVVPDLARLGRGLGVVAEIPRGA